METKSIAHMQQINSDEVSLKEIIIKLRRWLNYLFSKWLIILTCGIIGGGVGIASILNKKPLYVAELSFVLEDSQSSGINGYSGLASIVGIDLGNTGGGGVFSGDNLIEFMRSRSIIEKTLLASIDRNGKQETLAEFYIYANGLRKVLKKDQDIYFLPNEDRSMFTRKKDSILLNLGNGILGSNLFIARKDKKLSIITVTVKSVNELFSKRFAETLVKVVSEFYIETRTKKAAANLAILQRQTDSIRQALFLAITRGASSVDINPNLNPAHQILRAPSQNRQADVQVNSAILQTLAPNLEMAKVTLQKETPLIQEIDKPTMPLKVERPSKLKRLVIGGLCGGLIAVFFLISKKVLGSINHEI